MKSKINIISLKQQHGGLEKGWTGFVSYLFDKYEPAQFEESLWSNVFKSKNEKLLNDVVEGYLKKLGPNSNDSVSSRYWHSIFRMAFKAPEDFLVRNIKALLKLCPTGLHEHSRQIFERTNVDIYQDLEKEILSDSVITEDLMEISILRWRNFNLFMWGLDHKLPLGNLSIADVYNALTWNGRNSAKENEAIEQFLPKLWKGTNMPNGKGLISQLVIRPDRTEHLSLFFKYLPNLDIHIPGENNPVFIACTQNNMAGLDILLNQGANLELDFNNQLCDGIIRGNNQRKTVLAQMVTLGGAANPEYESIIETLLEKGAQWEEPLQRALEHLNPGRNGDTKQRLQYWIAKLEQRKLQATLDSNLPSVTPQKARL